MKLLNNWADIKTAMHQGVLGLLLITVVFLLPSAEAATLSVVTELSPPYQTMEQNHIGGSATEKVRDFLKLSNIHYEISMFPWARAYLLAENQPNTLIYSMAKTASREDKFHWLIQTYEFKPYLLGKKNITSLQLTKLDQAKTKLIAVQRSDFAHDYLLEKGFIEGKNLVVTNSIVDSWHLLKNGKVDYIVEELNSDPAGIDVAKHYQGYLALKPLWQQTYLAAHKSIDPTLLEQLLYGMEKYELEVEK